MRLHALEQWLKDYGVTVTTGSKHFQANKDGYPVYPIPAHNGRKTEVQNKYLKTMCKHFGIDPKNLPI